MNYLEHWRVLMSASIAISLVLIGIVLMLSGCTKLTNEPKCACECKENSSYFECGGIHTYHSTEIK